MASATRLWRGRKPSGNREAGTHQQGTGDAGAGSAATGAGDKGANLGESLYGGRQDIFGKSSPLPALTMAALRNSATDAPPYAGRCFGSPSAAER